VREFTVEDVLLYLIKELIKVDELSGGNRASDYLGELKSYLNKQKAFDLLMHTLGVMFEQLEEYIDDWDNLEVEYQRAAKLQLLLVNY
jgi:hypothetical protein